MSCFHHGNERGDIAFIAEAPGVQEVRADKPLVGPTGYIFDQLAHQAGLIRAPNFIGNVCRVKISDGKELLTTKGWTERGREEYEAFVSRVRAIHPKVWVPMGNIALYALTGNTGITKFRGSPLPCTLPGHEGELVIPTIHPAATIHGQYMWRYNILSDFNKIQRHLRMAPNQSHFPTHELIIDPDYSMTMDFLHQCRHADKVFFDTEWFNHQVSCFSLSVDRNAAICIPFYDPRSPVRHRWDEESELKIWLELARVLGRTDMLLVVQNLLFDVAETFNSVGIHTKPPYACTMTAHSLIYPDLPMGLDYLCSVHTDEPYYKDDRKLWKRMEKDLLRFWTYSAKDAATLPDIWDQLEPDLHPTHTRTFQRYMDLIEPLTYMAARGLKTNVPALAAAREDINGRIEEAAAALAEAASEVFNPNSPKDTMRYFYGVHGIKPYISRSTGNPSVDDESLQRLATTHDRPEARLLQQYRSLKKLSSTYFEMGLDRDERMRCSVNLRGNRMGRLSTSQTIRGTGGNQQNLHPQFKHFLEAG